jgi:hypothetical protein
MEIYGSDRHEIERLHGTMVDESPPPLLFEPTCIAPDRGKKMLVIWLRMMKVLATSPRDAASTPNPWLRWVPLSIGG